MGGTGYREWADARLLRYGPRSIALLAKGKRTNGVILSGKVLALKG